MEIRELIDFSNLIEDFQALYPFNDYEFLIHCFIEKRGLTYEQYCDLRTEYINANQNIWAFEITESSNFEWRFAQGLLLEKCRKLQSASKKLDSNYGGQYDLWLDGIRIEVKASRVVDSKSKEPLYMKALSSNTEKHFLMNFQQLKPQYCDVFIWVAVFRDKISIWVMSAKEVLEHPDYSKGQHRGNKGNEGQLHIKQDNIQTLNKFELKEKDLAGAIKDAAKRNGEYYK